MLDTFYDEEEDYWLKKTISMTTQDKRKPSYNDNDEMPFGKHKGESMGDVPASYLLWLSNQDYIQNELLRNYIWNCQDDIEQETGERIGIK